MTSQQVYGIEFKHYTEQQIESLIKLLSAALERPFEDAEAVLIDALLHDFSRGYEEIARTHGYSKNYLRGQVGPRLWQELSNVFQHSFKKPINKANFERLIRYLVEQFPERSHDHWSDALAEGAIGAKLNSTETTLHGDREHPTRFYGREAELQELTHLLSAYQCISLVGAIGIGKTAIAAHWVQLFSKATFKVVVWRSIVHAPTPDLLVNDLLSAIQAAVYQTKPTVAPSLETLADKLNFLMALLQQHRCLIVLDCAESIIQTDAISALNAYGELEEYNQLIRYIAEQQHQSCLLLLSRQRFNQIIRLHHSQRSAQEMMISGLPLEAAEQILADYQLKDRSSWSSLIDLYQGNPGLLIQISRYIQTCFGNQVRRFLHCNTIVVPDEASKLYLEQIQRLRETDRILLFDLATQTAPVQITELYDVIQPRSTLIKSLTHLVELCLVERQEIESEGESVLAFYLTPVVKKVILTYPLQSH